MLQEEYETATKSTKPHVLVMRKLVPRCPKTGFNSQAAKTHNWSWWACLLMFGRVKLWMGQQLRQWSVKKSFAAQSFAAPHRIE